MAFYILIAFLNGVVIGMARTITGQLGYHIGPVNASLWVNFVGLVFLAALILGVGQPFYHPFDIAPPFTYLAGLFGVLFITVSSYVFPRLGAVNTALFIISGQMVTAVLLDWMTSGHSPTLLSCLGTVIVILAIYLSGVFRQRRL